MVIMITGNSDHEIAVGNPVVNFRVPVVLIRGMFTGVCLETIHMATAEFKPRDKTVLP